MRNFSIIFLLFFFGITQNIYSQCTVTVDIANLQHINCPNGGAVGGASIIQASYINYSWQNITNGQLYNGGGGYGGTIRTDLDAGLYVITASTPYSSSCPSTIYSDTFEILEAEPVFQFNPTQACPDTCNVEVTVGMQIAITGVNYSSSFDSYLSTPLPYVLDNQCGGLHTYEIFANGVSCGIENIGISQLAQMNLATSVINTTCTQQGSATVNITGVGASAILTYCNSTPQYNSYTTIDNIVMVGDNITISNNTSGICDTYQNYTSQSADVTPGSSYTLNIDLGTCHTGGFALIDIANVYVDWNIDGDFNDLNEWVGQVNPTQSPSTHTIAITVPVGAIPGQSRMRIVAQNNQYQQSTNQAFPCDVNTAWFGSTEDYTLVVSGSVATPVSYLWSDGQTTATANLGAGTYTVTITDANGCTSSDTAIVNGLLFGCMNPLAFNYDPNAQCDDGSCLISQPILGCTDSTACNYDSTATIDDGSCITSITVNITPTLQTICQNSQPSNLTVTSSGSLVLYQYQWYEYSSPNQSLSAAIIPNETDSFFLPLTNTVGITYYYCVVTGGQSCRDTSAIVTVETVLAPIFTLQPQDSVVCTGSNLTINIADTFFVTVAANAINPTYQWYENSICDTSASGGSVPSTGPGNNTNTYTPQTTTPGTTYYYCVVVIPEIIGCNTLISECAEIIVNPTPTVTLSAVPTPACLGDDIQLTSTTSIPVNQYRFQYDNGGGWTNLTNPGYGLLNPVTFSNISTTTQFRVKVREYNGCINSSWSPIITVPVNIAPITGPIWHN